MFEPEYQILDGRAEIKLKKELVVAGILSALVVCLLAGCAAATREAVLEMHRQVGVARAAEDGPIYRGLMIRHLVMPNRVAGTKEIVEWIARNLPEDTYLNIMPQYQPTHEAPDYPEISRRITRQEYAEALDWALEAGLTNLYR